jgi:hypothetical protein
MNLLMALFFASAVVGLVIPRFGARESWAVAGLAAFLTALYYFFPARFM